MQSSHLTPEEVAAFRSQALERINHDWDNIDSDEITALLTQASNLQLFDVLDRVIDGLDGDGFLGEYYEWLYVPFRTKNWKVIEWVIQKDVYYERYILEVAIREGDVEVLEFLATQPKFTPFLLNPSKDYYQEYFNTKPIDETSFPPVLLAIKYNQLDILKWLVDTQKHSLDIPTGLFENDIIYMACTCSGLDMFEWLLTNHRLTLSTSINNNLTSSLPRYVLSLSQGGNMPIPEVLFHVIEDAMKTNDRTVQQNVSLFLLILAALNLPFAKFVETRMDHLELTDEVKSAFHFFIRQQTSETLALVSTTRLSEIAYRALLIIANEGMEEINDKIKLLLLDKIESKSLEEINLWSKLLDRALETPNYFGDLSVSSNQSEFLAAVQNLMAILDKYSHFSEQERFRLTQRALMSMNNIYHIEFNVSGCCENLSKLFSMAAANAFEPGIIPIYLWKWRSSYPSNSYEHNLLSLLAVSLNRPENNAEAREFNNLAPTVISKLFVYCDYLLSNHDVPQQVFLLNLLRNGMTLILNNCQRTNHNSLSYHVQTNWMLYLSDPTKLAIFQKKLADIEARLTELNTLYELINKSEKPMIALIGKVTQQEKEITELKEKLASLSQSSALQANSLFPETRPNKRPHEDSPEDEQQANKRQRSDNNNHTL